MNFQSQLFRSPESRVVTGMVEYTDANGKTMSAYTEAEYKKHGTSMAAMGAMIVAIPVGLLLFLVR